MPNRVVAIQQFLKDDDTVAGMTKGRIYTYELPDPLVAKMPVPTLVINPAGSANTFGGGYQQISDERLDIRHYAYTMDSAYDLYGVVFLLLKNMRRTLIGDTLVHWCRKAGGPVSLRAPNVSWPGMTPDPSLHWPAVNASWQVLAADVAPVPN